MQETSRYAVGLDVGTSTVRVVVGHIEDPTQAPTIVGVASEPNNGMRKGTVVNLVSVAQAIDKALEAAERMSGHQIQHATVSINGSHIVGISSKGVIAVGASGHEIAAEDIERAHEAATVLQLPANREIVEVTPRSYQLDGQENIKDPLGMTGVRLEVACRQAASARGGGDARQPVEHVLARVIVDRALAQRLQHRIHGLGVCVVGADVVDARPDETGRPHEGDTGQEAHSEQGLSCYERHGDLPNQNQMRMPATKRVSLTSSPSSRRKSAVRPKARSWTTPR